MLVKTRDELRGGVRTDNALKQDGENSDRYEVKLRDIKAPAFASHWKFYPATDVALRQKKTRRRDVESLNCGLLLDPSFTFCCASAGCRREVPLLLHWA